MSSPVKNISPATMISRSEISRHNTSPISRLHPEDLIHIFSYLRWCPSKTELHSKVISHTSSPTEVEVDTAQLFVLLLVSRRWNALVTPILWRYLDFTTRHRLDAVLRVIGTKHHHSLQTLYDYGSMVRGVSIRTCPTPMECRTLVEACPRVRDLTLDLEHPRGQSRIAGIFASWGAGLETLRFGVNGVADARGWLSFAKACSSLRNLFFAVRGGQDAELLLRRFLDSCGPRLRSLTVEAGDGVSAEGVMDALVRCWCVKMNALSFFVAEGSCLGSVDDFTLERLSAACPDLASVGFPIASPAAS